MSLNKQYLGILIPTTPAQQGPKQYQHRDSIHCVPKQVVSRHLNTNYKLSIYDKLIQNCNLFTCMNSYSDSKFLIDEVGNLHLFNISKQTKKEHRWINMPSVQMAVFHPKTDIILAQSNCSFLNF